jgi:hypothetical protein
MGHLFCLNAATGDVIWQSAVPGGELAGYASASVIEAAGRKQYVQFTGKGIVGVDAKTGQFLWRYDEASKGPANMPTPVASGSYVYGDYDTGRVWCLRYDGGRVTVHRALFSGSAVERVPQLQFQRPEAVIELSPEDAQKRSIEAGETVTVLANGTSVELRARINRRLMAGAARAAEEHVRDLPDLVEVRP